MSTELTTYAKSMDGYMEPDEAGQWVRLGDALAAIGAAPSQSGSEEQQLLQEILTALQSQEGGYTVPSIKQVKGWDDAFKQLKKVKP